jgi:hypothetical protein
MGTFAMIAAMIAWIALILFGSPDAAQAAEPCRLSPDNRSVTVVVSNPFPLEVSYKMTCTYRRPDGGTASVSCKNMVPASARDFVLCTRTGWDEQE